MSHDSFSSGASTCSFMSTEIGGEKPRDWVASVNPLSGMSITQRVAVFSALLALIGSVNWGVTWWRMQCSCNEEIKARDHDDLISKMGGSKQMQKWVYFIVAAVTIMSLAGYMQTRNKRVAQIGGLFILIGLINWAAVAYYMKYEDGKAPADLLDYLDMKEEHRVIAYSLIAGVTVGLPALSYGACQVGRILK